MRLLLVDDCVEIVNILSSFLEMSGYETDKSKNGIEAVELLQTNIYDTVITDAEMPGMDGMELCQFIKTAFPSLHVIGISGSSHSLDKLKAAGANDCFAKPFRICEIEQAIENRVPS